MKQIKLNTADFLSELIDNLNDIWRDEVAEDNNTIISGSSWDTARFIENRIDDFDETPLLVRISSLGSEFYHSTQGFGFDLLGSNKILTFESFNTKPKSMRDFEQFLSQCLDEIALIPDTKSPLNTAILDAFHQRALDASDLEVLLNVKNQMVEAIKQENPPVFSYPEKSQDATPASSQSNYACKNLLKSETIDQNDDYSDILKAIMPLDVSAEIATLSDQEKEEYILINDDIVYEDHIGDAVVQLIMVNQAENGGAGFSYTRHHYPNGLESDYSTHDLASWGDLDKALAETKFLALKLKATLRKRKEPGFDVTHYNPKQWRRIDTNDDKYFIFEPTDDGVALLETGRMLNPIEFAQHLVMTD